VTKSQSAGPISCAEHRATRVLHCTIVTREAVLIYPLLLQTIISNQMRPRSLRGAWFSRILRHPASRRNSKPRNPPGVAILVINAWSVWGPDLVCIPPKTSHSPLQCGLVQQVHHSRWNANLLRLKRGRNNAPLGGQEALPTHVRLFGCSIYCHQLTLPFPRSRAPRFGRAGRTNT